MAVERLHAIGIDHHRASVAVRERVAIAGDADLGEALEALSAVDGVDEALILSTCNRFEAYWVGQAAPQQVLAAIADDRACEVSELADHHVAHEGQQAIRHIFRVAGSLESLVVGEYQIVHQLRNAYEHVRQAGHAGPVLNQVCQSALATAKRVRTETAIGRYRLSIASVAVDLARQIHGKLEKQRLLVVGAGEMAELTVQHLIGEGVHRIAVVNRRRERAMDLAAHVGEGVSVEVLNWADLGDALRQCDMVVSSTAAPHAVITQELAARAVRRRRSPLMLVDLAVPRDIEPAVGDLEDAYVFNIDHLEQVAASNQKLRDDEVSEAATLVDDAVATFVREHDDQQRVLARALAERFEQLVGDEHQRLVDSLGLDDATSQAVRSGLSRLANKLRHPLLAALRDGSDDGARDLVRQVIAGGSRQRRNEGA